MVMERYILITRAKTLYNKILKNKLITICVLFTIITVVESLVIVSGKWPPKVGIGPYVHMLGRFVLNSILVSSLYIFEILKKYTKSKLIIYIITYVVTWALILVYVWMNGFFIELQPDAYVDVSRSYAFMYVILGIVFFIGNKAKQKFANR